MYSFTVTYNTIVSDCAGKQEVKNLTAGATLFDSVLCTFRTQELFFPGIGNVRKLVALAASSEFSANQRLLNYKDTKPLMSAFLLN
jgi:hypothetical protein